MERAVDKSQLIIGTKANGAPFTLPREAALHKFATLAMSGSGKTYLNTIIAEQMILKNIPWIAFDPSSSTWWGLRVAAKNGRSFPVVVLGGKHGDLQIDKSAGRRVAEAFMLDPVHMVIDLKTESKATWRRFMTDLALALLEFEPRFPVHVFVEEAPDLVPQRMKVRLTAECKEAVERLVRVGGNNGIGCSLLSQRAATVDKDVLSQCESLFVLGTMGAHDRNALRDWMDSNFIDREKSEKFFRDLVSLPVGEAWFWSPRWLKVYEKIKVGKRQNYHPREKWSDGKLDNVEMGDASRFIDKLKTSLSKVSAAVTVQMKRKDDVKGSAPRSTQTEYEDVAIVQYNELESLRERIAHLEAENRKLKHENEIMSSKLNAVRNMLRPQYEAMSKLFSELKVEQENGAIDVSAYEQWLQKAAKVGARRMLSVLLEKRRLTRTQLGTLSGAARTKSTYRRYESWLRSNQLVRIDGDFIELNQL